MMGPQEHMASGSPGVLAVVITYNPDQRLLRHLQALRSQCDAVAVIDNGSANLGWVEEACVRTGCLSISNRTNLGVAAALSQAARMAQEGGFDWLATFDQDSFCPPGAIDGLLKLFEVHPQRDQIAVLGLAHRDRATGRNYHHRLDILVETNDWLSLRTTITSGSLIRVDLFRQVGLFDDRLFIDAVDHEFCLRVRKHGWLVIEGRHYVLEHSIGEAKEHRLFGYRIACTHHSATRRYYMTRNQLEVCARNLLVDPVWATKGLLQFAKGSIVALLYESDKLAKLGAILAGIGHFALRRFGPRA